jgi:predicted small lipoprotein YifL
LLTKSSVNYRRRSGKIRNVLLNILLITIALSLSGCGKAGLKDPAYLPGLDNKPVRSSIDNPPSPIFNNGDIVRHKMLDDKQGIMMKSDYRYSPDAESWYCIVDFYPSSALIHFDFSEFDDYERRYVYEFELELVKKYCKKPQIPHRWESMNLLIKSANSSTIN